ncbi:MAG: family 43 glycosylhydrolase [Ignavibacteriaceae bacterium]
MLKQINITLSLVLLLITLNCAQELDSTYTNPVGGMTNIGDPSVLKYDDNYYLYATSEVNRGFIVWQSHDLVHWNYRGFAFDSYLKGNEWGKGDFWAPDVKYYNGSFFMFYSARASDGHLEIALAKADNPLGPFINIIAPFIHDTLSYIDPDLFIDDDGTPYLYYVKDLSENIINGIHMSQIYVQQLSKDLHYTINSPKLALQPSQDWEKKSGTWLWNEAPYLYKHNNKYYLMYSANYFASPDYSIGYAVSSSPLGSWEKYFDNPILAKNLSIGVSGPGSNCVVSSPDGKELFIIYHSHTYINHPSGNRELNIDRIYFDSSDNLKVIGPTRSPQPMPSGYNITLIKGANKSINTKGFKLYQNYPNPFNPSTVVEFYIPNESHVKFLIYNVYGQVIETVIEKLMSKGQHETTLNMGNYPSGVYFYEILTDNYKNLKKMLLIK